MGVALTSAFGSPLANDCQSANGPLRTFVQFAANGGFAPPSRTLSRS